MGLVFIPQALKNEHSLLLGRLAHRHRLEPALKRGVFFDVFTIFIDGGSADDLQIAAGEGGLQDIGRVGRTLGRAGPHNGMHLINKQNDISSLFDLVNRRLDALLKVAAILGAGDHAGQIEGDHPFVLE